MPNRTIYIKEEDMSVFNKAQESGSESISAIVIESLRRYIQQEEEKEQKNQEKVKISALLDLLWQEAIALQASDIHIQPCFKGNLVQMRVEGNLRDFASFPQDLYPIVIEYLKTQAHLNTSEAGSISSGRISIPYQNQKIEILINRIPSVLGDALSLKIIDSYGSIPSLENLEPGAEHESDLARMLRKNHGLILVTGPSASGKTTTMYSLLQHLKANHSRIITIENSIAKILDGAIQIPLRSSQAKDYCNAIRSAMHSDPDVLMVDTLQDTEVARLCIEIALKGHLVLCTTGDRSALGTLKTLAEMGIERYLLKEAIGGIVSQRRLRSLCERCKELYEATENEKNSFPKILVGEKFFRATGCPQCRNTGYKGQLTIMEVLLPDKKWQQVLLQKTEGEITKEEEMSKLWDDAILKARKGFTSLYEVLRVLSSF